jgi:hypothetical protein
MSIAGFSPPSPSPASLFIELWHRAGAWTPTHRATASKPSPLIIDAVRGALKQPDTKGAHDALARLLTSNGSNDADERGRILTVMREIDKVFLTIHPRMPVVPPSAGRRPSIPTWLRDLRSQRNSSGDYGQDADHRLVPRGPLVRGARDEAASNADSLADLFAALAVVPVRFHQEYRPITVAHRVLPAGAARGVVRSPTPGSEVVAFIPVAERHADLIATEREIFGRKFVDFQPGPEMNAAERVIGALVQAGKVDIAMAPELVMPEDHADRLADALLSGVAASPRVIIAGSGPTRDRDEEQSWNEARVLNGRGAELWRQRKMWPAALKQARALECKLSDPGPTGQILEDTAAGGEVVIVDIDGLGRCVILICQDIEARPLAEDLIRHFQPDWVFMPILDPGIAVGRWAHQRTFSLSAVSQARFLVACSTTMALWQDDSTKEPACGLAVGPKETLPREQNRLHALVSIVAGSSPGYATITWGSGLWENTTLTYSPVVPPAPA